MRKDYKNKVARPLISTAMETALDNILNEQDVKKVCNILTDTRPDIKPILKDLNNAIYFTVCLYPLLDKEIPNKDELIDSLNMMEKYTVKLVKDMSWMNDQSHYYPNPYTQLLKRLQDRYNCSDDFLKDLYKCIQRLSFVIPTVIKDIKLWPNKKEGVKSYRQRLARQLIVIYENITNKDAKANFSQPATSGVTPYRGELYRFISKVFQILSQKKELIHLKDHFQIDSESPALGRAIDSILKQLLKTKNKVKRKKS